MKSHSASKKRFKKTSSGKLKFAHGYRRHHAWAKTNKQGRQLRGKDCLSEADTKKIAQLVPYL